MNNTQRITALEESMNNINAQVAKMSSALDKIIARMDQQPTTPAPKKKTGKKSSDKVPFTKHDGTVIYGTQAQVDAWAKWQAGYPEREQKRKENLAKFDAERASYKPSKALIDAIKKDRTAITKTVAIEKYGFVGTRDDLKALKAEIFGK